MRAKRSIAIAAGGTAGHVNPALALAEELRDRGHTVRFYGETRRLEGRLVPEAGFELVPVSVRGFDRARPWTAVSALAHMVAEERRLLRTFRADRRLCPDVAIGFGAYVELPLIRAARRLGIPVAIHEQNSVPGLANKQSARHAALIAIAQPSVASIFKRAGGDPASIRLIGNPVRSSVLAGSRSRGRRVLQVGKDETLLVVFGGSLGARHLNERMVSLKADLLELPHLRIVHSTGADDFDATAVALALTPQERARWDLRPYIEDMGDMLAAADLVLSRSGASSIAEIAALAVPAVLVPYPHATADHQTTNARYLVDAGAAVMCTDAKIDDPAFKAELLSLVTSPKRREHMREAAQALGQDQAASMLADALEAL
ncbi:undecaprenyldiphospho-muramoylpentapeptide beta-N-acetylglucosaminyltransferase [Collinsella sp. AGMB00827]|uniref:UDP-N-acetylglucosamine--N-acetylmuramyl-(pentapeptide) pyrophosphoryl-undecaprenol N-acetylglucosamine transferase n=1 Tax=Collinsella ureilytica TaxID=2869515 RepID=A0ABS7MHU7_9ACTN|nr:undecaprenyldiphospho-muramoylpentapeptide beta-N-acetylglucosaminyltransferase [Collinsella urealyticum]MBY4796934.1 undecaprenyldiphospho-muramoylpentapeptide beta-N-acetylglucosaminyltransferase [Collinsella urealyticum]